MCVWYGPLAKRVGLGRRPHSATQYTQGGEWKHNPVNLKRHVTHWQLLLCWLLLRCPTTPWYDSTTFQLHSRHNTTEKGIRNIVPTFLFYSSLAIFAQTKIDIFRASERTHHSCLFSYFPKTTILSLISFFTSYLSGFWWTDELWGGDTKRVHWKWLRAT